MDEFAHRLRYAIDRSDMQQKELVIPSHRLTFFFCSVVSLRSLLIT